MHVHRAKRLAFLPAPKTASQATRDALLNHYGFEACGGHHDGPNDVEGFDPSDWYFFTTVRNPFDLLLSFTWGMIKAKTYPNVTVPALERVWEKNPFHYREPGQLFRFLWEDWPRASLTILRYEFLHQELSVFLRKEGFSRPLGALELVGPTRDKPKDWRPWWSPEAREYIETRHAAELERLGYNFNGEHDGEE
jgi:hypothetical protein